MRERLARESHERAEHHARAESLLHAVVEDHGGNHGDYAAEDEVAALPSS